LNVHYEYFVNQKKFKSSVIAFWFINSPKETYWENKNFYPKIAVLKRGPDIFLLLIFSDNFNDLFFHKINHYD